MIPQPPPRPAGLGHAATIADFDFETYSEAGYVWDEPANKWRALEGASQGKKGLSVVSAAAYSEHPSTEVLCMAYDLKDGTGPHVWLPGEPNPQALFDHLARGGLLEAWNVGFERLIWRNVCMRRYGWPALPLAQLRCAMAKSRAHGLPGKLEIAGDVTGVDTRKDKDGKRLLDKFSVPRNPTKLDARRRIRMSEEPLDGSRLVAYNVTDIKAEAALSAITPDLEGEELEFWQVDQAINDRGVHIDVAGVRNCIAIVQQAHQQYNAELHTLTGGTVTRASELAKLQGWLGAQGVHMDSMEEETIAAKLRQLGEAVQDGSADPAEIAAPFRALEIRAAVGSASVKKVYAMALQVCGDDRLRELFSYHAARTGRPTGNGPQPTNLPKAGPTVYLCRACGKHATPAKACPWCAVPRPPGAKPVEWCVEAAEDVLAVMATRSLAAVEYFFRDAMLAVSGVLRSLFTAAPGHELICSDFSAIEAVVVAAISGEQWRLEVFRNKRDIYLESISRSTGIPVDVLVQFKRERGMHHPLRQKGKIQELSLGYMGWIGALRAFGAEGTDDELKAQVLAWRAASPAIVELAGGQSRDFGRTVDYFGLEGAAVLAIKHPGREFEAQRLDRTGSGISYLVHDDVLYCRLPSGRRIAYHRPRLSPSDVRWRGEQITFEGYNTNATKGPPGWMTMPLYAGIFIENVCQAVARDIQRFAMVNEERAGYPVVLHVYDEIVAEVPAGYGSTGQFEQIMATMPAWAQGWPIRADGGWRGLRYRKG
ncbi:MAG: hypothetical protein EOO54_08370 [Haliea sp.]|nr:MAG: hypothetical protein EOO54_08370 [Haliea sp.]